MSRFRSSFLVVVACLLCASSSFAKKPKDVAAQNRAGATPTPPSSPASPSPSPSSRRWANPQAFEAIQKSIEARAASRFPECVQNAQVSIALEENPLARLHLSLCLQQTGRLLAALESAKIALATGLRNEDGELIATAQRRVEDLLARIPHVRLVLPKNETATQEIKITFDGRPVSAQQLRQRSIVEPGDHIVLAEKTIKGERATFSKSFTINEGEDVVIEVILKPSNMTPSERDCAENAPTYEEKIACFERAETKPNTRIGLEMSGYTDSLGVHVLSPAINASVVSPTAGWNIGGSYILDVVTAASPDIVSMASRRFHEQRHAASLAGGYKLGPHIDPQVHGNVSSEPDYLARTIGASFAADLFEKSVTPRVGYSFSSDTIGIRNTPFSQYERHFATHEIEAGITFVLSKATLLVTGMSMDIERGEQSKLYRFVPMFRPENIQFVKPGQSVNDVNFLREDVRAREVLPRERNRYAAGVRINHRMSGDRATVRIDERLYTDTWGIIASTTDARYLIDLSERLRVWPHVRFHYQTGASFYRLAYPVTLDQNGVPVQVLSFRSTDRELSNMMTVTTGGGLRVALNGSSKANVKTAIIASGEVMWSKFFESLFVHTRTAVYGTVGFEVEF